MRTEQGSRPTDLPAPDVDSASVRAALVDAPTLVVLDDDPTGTQTIRDVPVLTRWRAEDMRWALAQDTAGFFVLTNTRSQSPADAGARVRAVVDACLVAAEESQRDVVFASRGDSTLRGHFPVEVDAVRSELERHGRRTDGIVLAPAYVDAGRVTVHGVHLLRDGDRLRPVAESEFARDATFGYRSSRLAEWVEEKSAGAVPAARVRTVDVDDLRRDDGRRARTAFAETVDGDVVAVDCLEDADLRRAVVVLADEERAGRRFVLQVGPSFVRARLGQDAQPALDDERLAALLGGTAGHGLVVVGSHVALTTRQLAVLRTSGPVLDVELDVTALLESADRGRYVERLAEAVAAGTADSLVVLSTSRRLVTGVDAADSLSVARSVSDALTDVVGRAVRLRRPAYVVAKGGITSSDTATRALGIERARVRGSLLPGIVSLWQADDGPSAGLPYVVFAGNVGDDDAFAIAVARLERARGPRTEEPGTTGEDKERS